MRKKCWEGGWNKTHEQVENVSRLDSFQLKDVDGWGHLWSGETFPVCIVEVCNMPEGGECILFPAWAQERGVTVKTSASPNGFGGEQRFFHCPVCGRRVRFLYLQNETLCCRSCAKLNYKSQQATKNDALYFHKGMDYASRNLLPPRFQVDGIDFLDYTPQRPRGMHDTTYIKHMIRFRRYQNKYAEQFAADLAKYANWL